MKNAEDAEALAHQVPSRIEVRRGKDLREPPRMKGP